MMATIDMVCPNCGGTGLVQDTTGEDVVCPVCEGTGVLLTDAAVGGDVTDSNDEDTQESERA